MQHCESLHISICLFVRQKNAAGYSGGDLSFCCQIAVACHSLPDPHQALGTGAQYTAQRRKQLHMHHRYNSVAGV